MLHVVSVAFSLKYFIGNQFDYFSNLDYNMTVACSDSEELKEYSILKKFNTFPIPIVRKISPFRDIYSIYLLYKFIKFENFDIVIAHSPKGGLIGILAAFLARTKKRIFFRHGLVFETKKGLKRNLLIFIEKLTSFFSTKVINVSPSLLNLSKELKLDCFTESIVLGKGGCNGIDTNLFKPRKKDNSKLVVGFVGRLCKDKGIEDLIKGWEYIKKTNTNVELLLVGPIDEREPLGKDIIYSIENDSTINWVGNVKNTSTYYNLMDIFILPSYREGFGMVNIEASSSGLPVITTKIVGAKDTIIENVTGIFTTIEPKSIASAIQYYIDNEKLRILHGQEGRKFVLNNFSEIKKNIELLDNVYN